eukprot:6195725-Pleurochrysis_carterae.AAC.3
MHAHNERITTHQAYESNLRADYDSNDRRCRGDERSLKPGRPLCVFLYVFGKLPCYASARGKLRKYLLRRNDKHGSGTLKLFAPSPVVQVFRTHNLKLYSRRHSLCRLINDAVFFVGVVVGIFRVNCRAQGHVVPGLTPGALAASTIWYKADRPLKEFKLQDKVAIQIIQSLRQRYA